MAEKTLGIREFDASSKNFLANFSTTENIVCLWKSSWSFWRGWSKWKMNRTKGNHWLSQFIRTKKKRRRGEWEQKSS
jgi:hypothetical protein